MTNVFYASYINTRADDGSTKGTDQMKSHQVYASLRRSVPHLIDHHEAIVRGLQASGLVDTDGVQATAAPGFMTLSAAAQDRSKHHLVKQVMAQAARFGIKLDESNKLDSFEISKQLKAAGATNDQCWRFKSCLGQLGVL